MCLSTVCSAAIARGFEPWVWSLAAALWVGGERCGRRKRAHGVSTGFHACRKSGRGVASADLASLQNLRCRQRQRGLGSAAGVPCSLRRRTERPAAATMLAVRCSPSVAADAPGRASISCSSAPPCPAWSAHSAQLVWRTPRHRHCAFSLGQQSRVRWPCCIVSGADSPVLPPKVVRAAALVQPQPGWRRQNTLLSFSDTGWIVTERQAALSNSRPYLHYSTSNVFSPLSMASRLVDLWERASSGSDRNAEALRVHPRFFVSCCRVQSFPCLALFALCFVGFVYPRLFVALLPAPLLLRKNLPGRQCAVLGRDIAV